MAKVYLSLGTNLGDKEYNLCEAIKQIQDQIGEIFSLSDFYATEPWGFSSENTFLNAAVGVITHLSPSALLEETSLIEKNMRRANKSVKGTYKDRIIDIDILLYDNLIIEDTSLIIPHPYMTQRNFVLIPLNQIAPNVIYPLNNKTINTLYKELLNT
ncbi:MAG: 2-amino-4-hydroxy-6-hydroxymethyldihydropteridine diphosphokinase [Tannerellaceae bacterium]|nr:2-amino-4-hydroxy-6-hydroxymethyldihydropteridine diphosphokinase [Tannerellaceae bacterium]